jgi:hypothetical protein
MALMIRHFACLLALALVCACVDEPGADDSGGMCHGELGTFATDGLIEWYAFGQDFSEFCSAGFGIAEDHARWVAQAWGTEPMPFDYGLFESRDEPCWPCASDAGACAVGGSATASIEVPDRHEIAHSVRSSPCFPLIEEGWAMLYGDHFEGAPTSGDIRLAVAGSNPGLPGMYYPIAMRFVAFLIQTRGITKLRELCAARSDGTQFEAAVLDTYGVTFDDLATEFDTYPEWSVSELRQDQACESADVLVGPTSWDFEFECGAPGIEGKLGVVFETQRLVELPQEAIYQFIFESPSDLELRAEIRSCTRQGMASSFFYGSPVYVQSGKPQILLLSSPYPVGVYVVRVRVVEPIEPVDLHMSVGPWP